MDSCNEYDKKGWEGKVPMGAAPGMPDNGSIVPMNGVGEQGEKTPEPNGRRVFVAGIVSCLLGGLVAVLFPLLGCLLVGYGVVLMTANQHAARAVLAFVCAIGSSVTLSLLFDSSSVFSAVVAALMAFAVALALAKKRLSPTIGYAIVLGGTAVLLGIDEVIATMAGTTVQDIILQMINAYSSRVLAVSSEYLTTVQSLRTAVTRYWPSAYLFSSLLNFAVALVGACIAAPKVTPSVEKPQLRDYDVPLWLVGVFVVALLAMSASAVSDALSDTIDLVCANVLVALRIALAIQGLAVIAWVVKTRNVGKGMAVCSYIAAVFLEIQLYFMAILGFVDVWANFRHLSRGRKTIVQDDDDHNKQSA